MVTRRDNFSPSMLPQLVSSFERLFLAAIQENQAAAVELVFPILAKLYEMLLSSDATSAFHVDLYHPFALCLMLLDTQAALLTRLCQAYGEGSLTIFFGQWLDSVTSIFVISYF